MTKKSIIAIGILFVLAIGGTVAYTVQKEKEAEALRVYEAKIEQQVNHVASELATIDGMPDENAKLEKLKELNKAYESYKKSEEKDKRVSAAYESSISKLKDSFKSANEVAVAENTINDLEKASIDDLKKHIEKLTGLNDKVELQSQSVYTKEEQETISSKIVALNKEYADKVTELEKKVAEEKKKKEEAAKKVAAEKKEDILALDDYSKYIEAYYEFSMKGNPMPPEQRGDGAPIPETAGVSNEKYSEIRWGIADYYGNAFKQGLITEEENNKSQKLALAKLRVGDYADSSENKDVVRITSENVISYLDEYVRANSSWELSYPLVETADDGLSTRVYFESQLHSPNRGYFIVTPNGHVSRFSNSGEPLKSLEELDD